MDDNPANGQTNPPGTQADTSDTGRSQFDNITYDTTPTLYFRLDDGILRHDLPGNSTDDTPPDEVIAIDPQDGPTQPTTAGYAIAIFDEGNTGTQTATAPQEPIGFASAVAAQEGVYEFTPTTALSEGSHFLTARVQMIDPAIPVATQQRTGFGARSEALEIVVDTTEPPVSFGESAVTNDGLHPDSDSGVTGGAGNQSTLEDRITNDETPTFTGRAEADAFVSVYLDADASNTITAGDIRIGETVAVPLDGTNQFPDGRWEITSTINMNDPDVLTALGATAIDGLRRILVTAEDVAGNLNDVTGAAEAQQLLDIFVDTQGPQIYDPDAAVGARHAVEIVGSESYNLFDHKDNPDGTLQPTPLVNSLRINVQDLPNRIAAFTYNALQENSNGDPAEDPGNFLLVGDANGRIPIATIAFSSVDNDGPGAGTGEIVLTFSSPLPDDRLTLTISDTVVDPAGNSLDGENNSVQPHDTPTFPTGDGQAGGAFEARFTVDSRPEVGVYHSGSVWVDINGNSIYDPDNLDYTNRDITYVLGVTTDDLFAGNFSGPGPDGIYGTNDDNVVPAGDAIADGFDKLAAYGRMVGGNYHWQIDTDNDGVPNIDQIDSTGINGLPVAGNFDGIAANGDEVGLLAGSTWWFDTNHDYVVDTSLATSQLAGLPVVGDFDGDGQDDLGTWKDDQFSFLLTNGPAAADDWPSTNWSTGAAHRTIGFGFIGVRETPVAADMDEDGIDDIGLWVPDRAGVNPDGAGEWYFLVSNDSDTTGDGLDLPDRSNGTVATLDHSFEPVPFGADLHFVFGDEFGVPVVGNFDPPVTTSTDIVELVNHTNPDNWADVNADGVVTPQDVLILINAINSSGAQDLVAAASAAPYVDTNKDGVLSAADVLAVINTINADVGAGGDGEAYVVDFAPAAGQRDDTEPAGQLMTIDLASLSSADSIAVPQLQANVQAIDGYFAANGQDEQLRSRDVAILDEGTAIAAVAGRSATDDREGQDEILVALDLDSVLSDIAVDVSQAAQEQDQFFARLGA